jgi:hypothetical protein
VALDYVNLTLALYDGSGNLLTTGTAVFTLSATLTSTTDNEYITQAPITATLGITPPVVKLIANDSRGINELGTAWNVTFKGVPGNPPDLTFSLTRLQGTDQFYSSQLQAEPVDQFANFLQGVYPGDSTQFLNGAGQWVTPPASGGGSGGAVASVNGQTGAVVLTAADVNAVASVNGKSGTVTLTAADVGAQGVGSIGIALDGPSTPHATIFQMPDNSIQVVPLSTYSLTGDDATWINKALARLTAPGTVGPTTVRLMNDGNYTIKSAIGGGNWTYGTWLDMNGATLTYSGTVSGGACINFQGNDNGGYPQGYPAGGAYNGIIISATTVPTTGIRYGAGENFTFKQIRVQGFSDSTSSSYGIVQTNANGWTEKANVQASIMECDNAFYVLTPTGSTYTSHEYNVLDLHIRCYKGQNGFVMSGNGAYLSGSRIHIYGNFGEQPKPNGTPGTASCIDLSAGGKMNLIWLCVEVETTGTGTYNWQTIKFGPASTGGQMNDTTGMLRLVGSNFTVSDAVASQFSFGGVVTEFNSGSSVGLKSVNSKPQGWL